MCHEKNLRSWPNSIYFRGCDRTKPSDIRQRTAVLLTILSELSGSLWPACAFLTSRRLLIRSPEEPLALSWALAGRMTQAADRDVIGQGGVRVHAMTSSGGRAERHRGRGRARHNVIGAGRAGRGRARRDAIGAGTARRDAIGAGLAGRGRARRDGSRAAGPRRAVCPGPCRAPRLVRLGPGCGGSEDATARAPERRHPGLRA